MGVDLEFDLLSQRVRLYIDFERGVVENEIANRIAVKTERPRLGVDLGIRATGLLFTRVWTNIPA